MVQSEILEQKILLRRILTGLLAKERVNSVRSLVYAIQQADRSTTVKEIMQTLVELQKENKIELREKYQFTSFLGYLKKLSFSYTFWSALLVTALTTISIFFLPHIQPWITLRIAVGVAFIIFLPGYALMELLFTRDMRGVERVALGIGLSVTLSPLVGLILDYTPWGIRLIPIVITLSIMTLSLMIAGTYRKFLLLKRRNY